MRYLIWNSQMCSCSAKIEVDRKDNNHIFVKPCDYEHVVWATKVAEPLLLQRLRELDWRELQDYKECLDQYVLFAKDSLFFRHIPTRFQQSDKAVSAHLAMQQHETSGVTLPTHCQDPELLETYLQGKRCREFQITNWLEDEEKARLNPDEWRLTWPEEYIVQGLVSEKQFSGIFGRPVITSFLDSLRRNQREEI